MRVRVKRPGFRSGRGNYRLRGQPPRCRRDGEFGRAIAATRTHGRKSVRAFYRAISRLHRKLRSSAWRVKWPQRQGTLDLMVVHRVGAVRPGEPIVLVAALHAHRGQAFEAVRTLMDYLKTDAPLWKKETGPDGARWIEPTDHDHVRRSRAEETA